MPKLPTIGDQATAETLLAELNAYVDAAQAVLAEDKLLELAGLDHVVDALCARVQAMPSEDGRAFEAPLSALHARLGVLQQQMMDRQATARDELKALNLRQKAVRAYHKEE